MFKIDANRTFTHTVKVRVPVDGGHEDQTFKATFAVIPTEEAATFKIDTEDGSRAFLARVVVGVDDIVGEDGQALPYNDGLRDRLLGLPHVRLALVRTYTEALTGAKAGN